MLHANKRIRSFINPHVEISNIFVIWFLFFEDFTYEIEPNRQIFFNKRTYLSLEKKTIGWKLSIRMPRRWNFFLQKKPNISRLKMKISDAAVSKAETRIWPVKWIYLRILEARCRPLFCSICNPTARNFSSEPTLSLLVVGEFFCSRKAAKDGCEIIPF